MMLKMGHKIHAEYQVCLAHGMHLAVIKVLYKKRLILKLLDLTRPVLKKLPMLTI